MKRKHQIPQASEIRTIDPAALVHVIGGDVYMQYPRGSNDRPTDSHS